VDSLSGWNIRIGWADDDAQEIPKKQGFSGYSLGREIDGIALFRHRGPGLQLLYRLKETRPLLLDEIGFWGGCMADVISGRQFDIVTHAPSSGKVPDNEHLATLLAAQVASKMGLPMEHLFVNSKQRGTRANYTQKLRERDDNPFGYTGKHGLKILVVDDAVYTRSTAIRCAEAAGSKNEVGFVILYMA